MHALHVGRVLLPFDIRFHVNPSIGSRILLFGQVDIHDEAFSGLLQLFSKALETALANPGCKQLGVSKFATRRKQFFITLLT